jgi:hypothetical protein
MAEDVLRLGRPDELEASELLGRLLLLGLVSGVEGYFRHVFSRLVKICPICRVTAAEQQVTLGALDYYGWEHAEHGVFDRSSFASHKGVEEWTRKMTGFSIPKGSDVHAALVEFDKICHLRHAAVHAQGALGSGNVRQIGLEHTRRVIVTLDFPSLHRAGAACHVAVRTFNRWLYEAVVTRWHISGKLTRVWTEDRLAFDPLYHLFRSDRDAVGPVQAKDAYKLLPFSVRVRR